MSGSVNKVILVGRLGADPEVSALPHDGGRMARFSIATSEKWKTRNGEKKERTEWHRVVTYNDGLVRIAENYLRKGAKVYIEGELRTRKWTDNSGTERFTTEVIIPNFKGVLTMLDGQRNGPPPVSGPDDYQYNPPSGDLDDDVPF